MAVCPHCQARAENVLDPCPSGDGYYCVEESDFASNRDERLLGVAVGGRFVVLALLGTGSMAEVYRSHQLEVDRTVALKVFRVDELFDPSMSGTDREKALQASKSRFVQEAKVLGKLAHPNCVTLYDFGTSEEAGYLYIAMEYVGGISLRRAINRGLKIDAIYEIAQQVLLALREAHNLDIVHRDLKPENIILSFKYSHDEPVVKVVDFGIAKLLGRDRTASTTNFGALFGTPAYMSPEQCRGEVDAVGPHSDVYALGCILFEMVTGSLPFPSQIPVEMIRMHIEKPVPEIRPRPGLQLPDEFRDFITTCLQKAPEDRYPDAHAALLALARIIDGDESSEKSASKIWRRGGGGAKLKGRVVVPKDRIAGVDIEPPRVEPRQTEGSTEIPIVVEGLTRRDGEGVYETHDVKEPPPAAAAAQRASASSAVTLLAFIFLLTAVIGLFYLIWQSLG